MHVISVLHAAMNNKTKVIAAQNKLHVKALSRIPIGPGTSLASTAGINLQQIAPCIIESLRVPMLASILPAIMHVAFLDCKFVGQLHVTTHEFT